MKPKNVTMPIGSNVTAFVFTVVTGIITIKAAAIIHANAEQGFSLMSLRLFC